MPIAPNFRTWEHLQRIVTTLHNYRVRDFWRENRYDRQDRPNDATIDRPVQNILQATKIVPEDSAVTMILKILLFEIIIGNAARLQPMLYGLPVANFDEYTLEQRPQVLLFFEEDLSDVPDGYARIQAEINFRLMNETSETITEANAKSLANKIKLVFGSIPTWYYSKGKYIYSYQDRKNGYWLQIYALNKTEGVEVIKKVLSIQNHAYNDELLKESSAPGKNSTATASTHIVFGKSVKRKRYRPEKKVRFRYAILKIDGFNDPVVLYDPYRRLNKPDLV